MTDALVTESDRLSSQIMCPEMMAAWGYDVERDPRAAAVMDQGQALEAAGWIDCYDTGKRYARGEYPLEGHTLVTYPRLSFPAGVKEGLDGAYLDCSDGLRESRRVMRLLRAFHEGIVGAGEARDIRMGFEGTAAIEGQNFSFVLGGNVFDGVKLFVATTEFEISWAFKAGDSRITPTCISCITQEEFEPPFTLQQVLDAIEAQ